MTLLETTQSWDGKELPRYQKGTPKITILKVRVPAKAKLELHRHPVINAAVILKGELTVITESNDTLHVRKGEALSEVVNTWHYGMNTGNVPAELIVFYAGSEEGCNTISRQEDCGANKSEKRK